MLVLPQRHYFYKYEGRGLGRATDLLRSGADLKYLLSWTVLREL